MSADPLEKQKLLGKSALPSPLPEGAGERLLLIVFLAGQNICCEVFSEHAIFIEDQISKAIEQNAIFILGAPQPTRILGRSICGWTFRPLPPPPGPDPYKEAMIQMVKDQSSLISDAKKRISQGEEWRGQE